MWLVVAAVVVLAGCGAAPPPHRSARIQSPPVTVAPKSPKTARLATTVPAARPRPPQHDWSAPVDYRDRVVVLMFHAILPQPGPDTITPAMFAADLDALGAGGFHVITTAQLDAFVAGRGTVPDRAVVITFDDGYQGLYQYGYPQLLAHHFPATLFAIAGWMSNSRHPDMLTWAEIREMVASGLLTVGGHTWDMHYAAQSGRDSWGPATVVRIWNPATRTGETDAQYRSRILADLGRDRQAVTAETGVAPVDFAFPYGATTPEFVDLLHQAGFEYLYTTRGWVNRAGESPNGIYRINVGNFNVTAADLVGAIYFIATEPHALATAASPASGGSRATGGTTVATTVNGGAVATGPTGSGSAGQSTASGGGQGTTTGTTTTTQPVSSPAGGH